ncbi:hypothetical protein A9Q96_07835 [Rhodobacterales bacterium 52_120_T64]|nr:hypothetical protein A9Q96_07835 [Rhodobacterales bacterium 52_120_T64]
MSEITDINWLATIVGFVLAFGLGMIWFSPKMFGTKWAEGVGLDPEGPKKPPAAAMTAQTVGTFLLAWTVGVTAANDALLTIILFTLTMVVLAGASGFFTGKSAYARHTEGGYMLAMVVIMIISHGIF